MDLDPPRPRHMPVEQAGGESLAHIASVITPKPDPQRSTAASSQPTPATHQLMHPQLDLPVASDSSILRRDASPSSSTNAPSARTVPVPQPALAAGAGPAGTGSDILAILNTFSQLPPEQRRALSSVLSTFTETSQSSEAPMQGDAPPSYNG
jgi:hypothetical protein